MRSEAKTVPMNLVIQPNAANEHPTYEWQPRFGCTRALSNTRGYGAKRASIERT